MLHMKVIQYAKQEIGSRKNVLHLVLQAFIFLPEPRQQFILFLPSVNISIFEEKLFDM